MNYATQSQANCTNNTVTGKLHQQHSKQTAVSCWSLSHMAVHSNCVHVPCHGNCSDQIYLLGHVNVAPVRLPPPNICTHSPSHTLENGEAQLLRAQDHLMLCLQSPTEQLEFSLFELPAAERRIEMKTMLFYVWDHFTATRSKLRGIVSPGPG